MTLFLGWDAIGRYTAWPWSGQKDPILQIKGSVRWEHNTKKQKENRYRQTKSALNFTWRRPISWRRGGVALPDFTAEPWCYGNHKLSPHLSITGFIGPNQVEEDSSNASWEMEGGAALQATAPQRLCGINTLANTMKHCINVSNYRLEERAGGGGGVQRWGGRNKDVPLAVNHSNRYGRKDGQSELLQWDEACAETLCAEMLRAKSQRRRGQRFNRYICNSKGS